MNERFKALLKEAGFTNFGPDIEQKFIRLESLVVNECARVSRKVSHREDDMGAIIARDIEKHFGVKE